MTDKNPSAEPAEQTSLIAINDPDSSEMKPRKSSGIIRLLVGGILEASNILPDWLDAGAQRHTESEEGAQEDPNQRAKHAVLGLSIRTAETTRRNLNAARSVAERVGGALLSPARGIFNSQPLRPLRDRLEVLIDRGEQEVEDWAQIGSTEERRSREMARETLVYAVSDVVRYLSTSPELEALIKSQIDQLADDLPQTTQIDVLVRVLADNYITYLSENPDQVQGLIRAGGDTYLEHLEENPEQVQSLVQGQSASLVEDITRAVRVFTVTGDSWLELIARKLFRRTPRAELPAPPPEVQTRARFARLEGETLGFTREEHD